MSQSFCSAPRKYQLAAALRKGKAFCECPFALHRQQPEKDQQNVHVTPLKNFCGRPCAGDVHKFQKISKNNPSAEKLPSD